MIFMPPFVSLNPRINLLDNVVHPLLVIFFFNDTATTEIYTLSYTTLFRSRKWICRQGQQSRSVGGVLCRRDRKSTRLNSSHVKSSYAVFCLKKKKNRTL